MAPPKAGHPASCSRQTSFTGWLVIATQPQASQETLITRPGYAWAPLAGRLALPSDQVLPEGVYHWTATHPEWEGPVSAYAIDDGERLILIDPIAVPDDVRALFAIARGCHGAHLYVA